MLGIPLKCQILSVNHQSLTMEVNRPVSLERMDRLSVNLSVQIACHSSKSPKSAPNIVSGEEWIHPSKSAGPNTPIEPSIVRCSLPLQIRQ